MNLSLLLSSEATSSQVVSHITGIPKDYFDDLSLEDASISMRMSWAAGRQATRDEDIAYALLGIFHVNMPLLYGEGKLKAFRRLQEEIMKASEDETLSAWISSGATPQSFSSGFLATDPADFSSTKHLIPFHTEGSVVPHTMTHRGLRIRMQLFDAYHSMSEVWTEMQLMQRSRVLQVNFATACGVLRCYLPFDPTLIVLLPLRWLDSDMCKRDRRNGLVTVPSRLVPDTIRVHEIYIRNSSTVFIADSVRHRFAFLVRSLPQWASITYVADLITSKPSNLEA